MGGGGRGDGACCSWGGGRTVGWEPERKAVAAVSAEFVKLEG